LSYALRCDDEHTLLALAVAGHGVVALNRVHAAEALKSGELVEVLPGRLQQQDSSIYLHCDASRFALPEVERCFKAIQQALVKLSQADYRAKAPV